jgi:hypothetical protein
MPFALMFIGIVFIVVAARDMEAPFLALLKGDFTGPGNFFYWILALFVVGAVGYIPKAKPVSDALLVAIILALVLAAGKKGVFSQLTTELNATQTGGSGGLASVIGGLTGAGGATGTTGTSGSSNPGAGGGET